MAGVAGAGGVVEVHKCKIAMGMQKRCAITITTFISMTT